MGKIISFFKNLEKYEYVFFLIGALYLVIHVFLTQFVVSVDGPHHLYNANIIAQIVKGNDFIKSYYHINTFPVGNWSGHFLLSFFMYFFPASIAEKLLLSTYYLGFVYAFRYLVFTLSKKRTFLSFLIFPFATHSLITLGFYNFSIAIALMMVILAIWAKSQDKLTWQTWLKMFLLSVLLYFSHAIIFCFYCAIIGLWFLFRVLSDTSFWKQKAQKMFYLKQALLLIASVLPAVAILAYYLVSSVKPSVEANMVYPVGQLFSFLEYLRFLVSYNHITEGVIYRKLFYFILSTGLIAIVFRIYKKIKSPELSCFNKDIWLAIAGVFLVLYLFVPEQMSIGYMSTRIGIILAIVFLVWLAVQKMPYLFRVIVLIAMVHFTIQQKELKLKGQKELDRDVLEVREAKNYMYPNTVAVCLNYGNVWVHAHIENYLFADMSVVFLQNTQANGKFPVVYNKNMPYCMMGLYGKFSSEISYVGPSIDNTELKKIKMIDYIFIWDYREFLATGRPTHKLILDTYYNLKFVSSHGNGALYEFKDYKRIHETQNIISSNASWVEKIKQNAQTNNTVYESELFLEALHYMKSIDAQKITDTIKENI
jgi:hypothetical protein